MIKILVTGGAGFIGSHVVRKIQEISGGESVQVTVIDSFYERAHTSRSRERAAALNADLHIVDITKHQEITNILEAVRPNVIIHLAAETSTGDSANHPTLHTHVNATGTAALIEAMVTVGHAPSHVVLVSSRAVYGEGMWIDPADGLDFYPRTRSRDALVRADFEIRAPSGEAGVPVAHCATTVIPRPVSVYGLTKLWQENILTLWCETEKIPISILRMQNVYGVGQLLENSYSGIIALFHKIARERKVLPLFEDGNIVRDCIYVEDAADIIVKCSLQKNSETKYIDVGTGIPITLLDAAKKISEIYNIQKPRITGEFRVGDVRWACADLAALNTHLGFVPSISFESGTQRIKDWLDSEEQMGKIQ